MQKEADEFLTISGLIYEDIKKRWRGLAKKKGFTFSDDIFNDSIIKTYDAILRKEAGSDYMGYWWRTFLNNSKRDGKYAYHNRDDDVDVFDYLKDVPYKEYRDKTDTVIRILEDVKSNFSIRSYYLFLMYYMLPDMTFEELKELTGVSDVKGIIMRIKEYLVENVSQDNDRDL